MIERKAWPLSSRSVHPRSRTARPEPRTMEVSLLSTCILAGVGLLAGFVDAIAGGGALLTLPALLLAGLDPVSALATNKLQGSFGSGSATYAFARRRLIDFRGSLGMV